MFNMGLLKGFECNVFNIGILKGRECDELL